MSELSDDDITRIARWGKRMIAERKRRIDAVSLYPQDGAVLAWNNVFEGQQIKVGRILKQIELDEELMGRIEEVKTA